ncbi:MAG: hypothetical protein HKP61_17675 [Dactylosporangium sp.]|nr:hypothetical protein [Dactylosporangium sp.]NNJ62727.1 hypothetical protein [Dactylosporangium sp.]
MEGHDPGDQPTPASGTPADFPLRHAPDEVRRAQAARRALAATLATELCDLPPAAWQRQATPWILTYIDDDPELAAAVADAWDLARSQPSHDQVQTRSGAAGTVVAAHGDTWSLVARANGPILLLTNHIQSVIRIDKDRSWQPDLTVLVSELIDVGRGLPPVNPNEHFLPSPPPQPWTRRSRA